VSMLWGTKSKHLFLPILQQAWGSCCWWLALGLPTLCWEQDTFSASPWKHSAQPPSMLFPDDLSQLSPQIATRHWLLPLLCPGHLIKSLPASSVFALQLGLGLLPQFRQTLVHVGLSFATLPSVEGLSWHAPWWSQKWQSQIHST
jgi:hypothetical protein